MANANDTKRIPAITVQPMHSVEGGPLKACPITEAMGLFIKSAGGKALWADPAQLTEALMPTLILHGLKQKLIDAAAISRDPDTGRSATVDDKWTAVEAVWERLLNGEWNAQRGDGTGTGGLLFKALCRMYPAKTPDDIRTWLGEQDAKAQAKLRLNPKVAKVIDEIRAESVKDDDIDSDELLAGLEGDDDEGEDTQDSINRHEQ